ncbi:MAG: regulatory iron-sulfur-containing complex subunit RicT [Sphaerochaetaceae bacterium]|jgi:cell fate regulator YaaT (PSP1 superfamily)
MRKDHYRSDTEQHYTNRPSKAYVYLVRNPSSNEISVCAWDSVLYPGTSVVTPTRYGLDMGIIVANAAHLGKSYVPGDAACRGACARCAEAQKEEEGEQDLVAAGQPDENGDPVLDEIEWNEEPDSDPCSECEMCSNATNPEMVDITGETVWIDRLATPADLTRFQELAAKEDEAMRICREKIALRKLDMKLVTAHFLLGEPKILFFFTADVRVDFRELVKDLVSVFRIRIELRQIGVRDESRVLGGLAICGRDFCCHCVTDKLSPVSIKMAKEQNLSLNSMKISGPCGRLLCCLAYEYDFYVEEKAQYPPEGSRLKVGDELMKITEVNILSKMITLNGSEGRMLTIPTSACAYKEDEKRWEITKEYAEQLFSE